MEENNNFQEIQEPDEIYNNENPIDELTPFDRFAKVLTSPTEAFDGLLSSTKKKSIIIWGLLFSIVAYSFAMIIATTSDGMKKVILDKQMAQFEKMKKDGKMSDEEIDKAREMMTQGSMTMIFGMLGIIVGTPLIWAIFGLLTFIVARILEKERNEGLVFSTAFAVTMIAGIISLIESVFSAIAILITDNEFSFSLNQIMKSENSFLKFLFGSLNPFTIWWLIVSAIGISVIARVEKGKSIMVCTITYLVVGLGMAGLSQLFKGIFSFGG
jgi:hypothetical protein